MDKADFNLFTEEFFRYGPSRRFIPLNSPVQRMVTDQLEYKDALVKRGQRQRYGRKNVYEFHALHGTFLLEEEGQINNG